MAVWKHRSSERLQAEAGQLAESGDFRGAALMWKHLVERHPRDAYALETLGTLRGLLGDYESAARLLAKAIEIDPTSSDAYYNLGIAYYKLRRFEEATSALQRAIEIAPKTANAYGELGRVLESKGSHEAAIAAYTEAATLAPEGTWLNELVQLKRAICDWNNLEELQRRLIDQLQKQARPITPLLALQMSDDPHLHRINAEAVFSQDYASSAPASELPVQAPRHRDENSRLRVGYMSGDFRDHAMSQLIVELIERHDRSRFEIIGFSHGPDDKSSIRNRVRKAFDRFIECWGLHPTEIAKAVRKQGIDVLIDLSGHTDYSQLEIFSTRAAPIQAHYLGFPSTLGCPWVDYLFVDPFVVPPGSEQHYAEALCFLPNTYLVTSRRTASEAVPTRASQGLPEGAFVFCSFNNLLKLEPDIFEVWLDILRRVPNSVLWLLVKDDVALSNLRAFAASRGVAEERIVPAKPIKSEAHLARQALADLFLDSFPYNAHTTASDALSAGVPLISCSGRSFASRVAGSILRAHGMEDLVVSNLSEYADLAVKIASTPVLAGDLKARVLANREHYPLFDTDRFRQHFESALHVMWQRFTRGEAPSLLRISDNRDAAAEGARPG